MTFSTSRRLCAAAILLCGSAGIALPSLAQGHETTVNKPATANAETNKPAVDAANPDGIIPDSTTEGSVTTNGRSVTYTAVAGTITVAADEGHDAQLALDGKWLPEADVKTDKPEEEPATARMFYAAYFAKGAPSADRPIAFLYNGGPGSSSMWLHMGSFGPRRVAIPDTKHQAAAPYSVVENPDSLLDVSDVVFIDAPGTGFSRIFGKDKEKSFWGTDQDAHAFDRFIRRFLTKYDRWNSPKYLIGESYGTTRSAALSAALQNVDLNGIVLLSAVLNFDDSADGPRWNPGVENPYFLSLPTFAATAYFHHKVPTQPAALEPFLREVEHWAATDYASALDQGNDLSDADRQAVAQKLYSYTGVPAAYWIKSDLRLEGGQFSKELQDPEGLTTGRLDTRFSSPDLRRTSEEADYDPQDVAISSAYTTAINGYVRNVLKFGQNMTYIPGAYSEPGFVWDLRNQAPGGPPAQFSTSVNVMPDLADSMKRNPHLHVMLAGGYYDLATPYFAASYEMHHLEIPRSLTGNVSYHFYESGHMVYVNPEVLHKFHGDVAAFIEATKNGK